MHYSNYIHSLAKDIRINGLCYIKSEIVAKKIKEYDSRINITWNSEDRTYIATFDKFNTSN